LSPDLATALREETPTAPETLRERVALIAATPAPPRRTFTFRRALLWGAPATAFASVAVAIVVGVIASSSPPAPTAQAPASRTGQRNLDRKFSAPSVVEDFGAVTTQRRLKAGPTPSSSRAQHVQANLRILVDDPNELSTATQRALRTTRRLGGYLVAVDYGTPEATEGTANLRVRVPVSRVQAAIVSFNNLGRILGQQTQITDLQQRLDELTRQIRRANGDKTRIRTLRRERIALNRRAAYATVDLALTTHEPEQKVVAPSRLDRAVDDATGVLTAELAIGAYILIVASPFLVLLAAAFAGSRAYRRYADQRLLERA
jgi:uncharacterized protein DUF4349